MRGTGYYRSPLGTILLAADEEGLCGLWFWNEPAADEALKGENKDSEEHGKAENDKAQSRIRETLDLAMRWLDMYFAGQVPDFMPPLHLNGSPFQQEVWAMLCDIPYGQTVSYGELARRIADRRGIKRMAAQAVGGAVGRNPVSILVPCHRVIGANGSLTGYGGGLEKKAWMLQMEHAVIKKAGDSYEP